MNGDLSPRDICLRTCPGGVYVGLAFISRVCAWTLFFSRQGSSPDLSGPCLFVSAHVCVCLWMVFFRILFWAVFKSGSESVSAYLRAAFVSGRFRQVLSPDVSLQCLCPDGSLFRTCLGGICLKTVFIVSPAEHGFQTLFCFHLHCYSMQNHFDETL